MKKKRTPFEEYINEKVNEIEKTAMMDAKLNQYGTKTPLGGRMWTVGDMQKFFADSSKRKRKRKK